MTPCMIMTFIDTFLTREPDAKHRPWLFSDRVVVTPKSTLLVFHCARRSREHTHERSRFFISVPRQFGGAAELRRVCVYTWLEPINVARY